MTTGQPTIGARWVMPAVVFSVVVVAQLWLVAVAGTDIPFHDQWDIEGRGLYPAMRSGTASLAESWLPHNEHRIVWTQLLNRCLFLLNGQWDPLVQLVVGACLHGLATGLLVFFLTRGWGRRMVWLCGIAATLLALPLGGWHNALWGFQTQVYFAIIFSGLAFGLLAQAEASVTRKMFGWLAAGAAQMAMGPGMLVPASLLGLGLVQTWEKPNRWPMLMAAVLMTAVAWGLRVPVVAHEALRPASSGQFLVALGRLLAWPHTGQPWAAIVLNLPMLYLLGGRLLRSRAPIPGEDFVVALAGWGWLVAGAAAWSRGGGDEFVAGVPSRYADFLMVLPLANLWATVVLSQIAVARWRWLAVTWGIFVLIGWTALSAEVVRGVILPRARDREAPVRLVREFQQTGDAAIFAGQPRLLVPHPNLESVRAVLDDPRMRGVLPPSLQPERPMGPLSRSVRRVLGR